MKLVVHTRPLLPHIRCARRAKDRYDLAAGLLPTDRLHVVVACEGFDAGTILPVLGYNRYLDAQGDVYALHAYVPGYGTTPAGRQAVRFPSPLQQEVLFQELPAFLTELDLTDHADALTLERLHEAVVIPMYPSEAHRRHAA